MIVLLILTTSLIHFSLKGLGERTVSTMEVKGLTHLRLRWITTPTMWMESLWGLHCSYPRISEKLRNVTWQTTLGGGVGRKWGYTAWDKVTTSSQRHKAHSKKAKSYEERRTSRKFDGVGGNSGLSGNGSTHKCTDRRILLCRLVRLKINWCDTKTKPFLLRGQHVLTCVRTSHIQLYTHAANHRCG